MGGGDSVVGVGGGDSVMGDASLASSGLEREGKDRKEGVFSWLWRPRGVPPVDVGVADAGTSGVNALEGW